MNRKPFILATLALGVLTAPAQINSPCSNGYEARAAAMLSDGNFRGCIDQCVVALKLGSNRRESLTWLQAVAAFKGGMPEASKLVGKYIKAFPNGEHIISARLMKATLTFYASDYRAAIKEFEAINPSTLSDNEREDRTYRMAYSLMQLAEYASASEMMQELAGTRRYGGAARFYEAYMAFATGDYERAVQLFALCDKSSAPGDMTDYYVGQILFRNQDYAEALNLLMPLMARKDVAPEFRAETERIVGECFYALHDDNRAMVYLNDYIDKHREDAPLSTRYIVGVERYQTGDYEDALELLAPVSNLNDKMGQSAALTMGQAYRAAGNHQAAVIAFDKAARMDFDDRLTEMAYYNYAVARVDGGRVPFGNTVQTLEDFLKRYPKSRYAENVREYLVKGYMATDDYDGALRSLNAMPNNHNAVIDAARQRVNFVLGTRALQSGNAAQAVSYLTEAMVYGASDADIEKQTGLWLGDAYYALGQYSKAAAEYKTFVASATAKDANLLLAQYNLGYSEFALRNYPAARNMFEHVVGARAATDDLKQDAYNRIGDTYYYAKELQEAKEAYEKALRIKPSAGDYPLLQIAMMQGHMADYAGKMTTLQKLIDEYPASPNRPVALTEMALTHSLTGNIPSAIALYKQIFAKYNATQHGRNALLQLAILSDNNGDTEGAKGYYRQVIADYPTSPEATLAVQDLKRIYGDSGDIMELDAFLNGIKDAPQLDATERNGIAAASLLKQARGAVSSDSRLEAAERLLTDYPDAAEAEEALAIAAKAHEDMGVPGKALARYSELEQKASSEAMLHAARIGILRASSELGDNERVIAVGENMMSSPAATGIDLPEVQFRCGMAYYNIGDSEKAERILTELSTDTANLYGTRAAFELAGHYYTAGNLESAERIAESLIDANPPHAYWLARTFILYSDILRAGGSDFEADEYLRVLRSNYPGTENDIFQMIDKRLPQ